MPYTRSFFLPAKSLLFDYIQIKRSIVNRYRANYLNESSLHGFETSRSLAECLTHINENNIITILEVVRDNQALFEQALTYSRKSDLFDKLVLMRGNDANPWVLRLHTYNLMPPSDKPGYIISNLGHEIRDDENHIHTHSWELASKFITGAFRNHKFIRSEITADSKPSDTFDQFQLVSTAGDGVTATNAKRKAVKIGQESVVEVTDELYQAGSVVHYPLVNPHKVDMSVAPYVGTTMTLALTASRKTQDSYFYERPQTDSSHVELDVAAIKYSPVELRYALNLAIIRIKLLQLCDQLASLGFVRFNRFHDPLLQQQGIALQDDPIANNVMETELLPTIAMIIMQSDESSDECSFEDTAMTHNRDVFISNDKLLIDTIKQSIKNLDRKILDDLMIHSQKFLMSKIKQLGMDDRTGFFVTNPAGLDPASARVVETVKQRAPRDLVLFRYGQGSVEPDGHKSDSRVLLQHV